MKDKIEYKEINRKLWNDRTEVHMKSDFYAVDSFLLGRNPLCEIELGLLGDVKGKTILHLQCHFGQDTLQLSRMGAEVTGVDLSDTSIEEAKLLAIKMQCNAEFICCDLYDLPKYLNKKFDIVFTSYGTVGWLPDLPTWASVVSQYLKPGAQFVMVDFHPFIWMFNDDHSNIQFRYFTGEAIVETQLGSYANPNADLKGTEVGWNHGLAEIVQSLLNKDLQLLDLQEYDYSPHNCFQGMVEIEKGKFQLEKFGDKIPLVYSQVFRKM